MLFLDFAEKAAVIFIGIQASGKTTFYRREFSAQGFNPAIGENVTIWRRTLYEEYELPLREKYTQMITALLDDSGS